MASATFDLLTLALLPGVAPRAAARARGARPARRRPRRTPRPTPTCSAEAARRRFASARPRAGAEAERAAPRALGVRDRGPGRRRTIPALLAADLRSAARPLRARQARRRRRRRAAWPSSGSRAATPARARPGPTPGPRPRGGRGRRSSRAWRAGSTPRPTGAPSTPAGRTVAVLGSGLDRIYPPENAGLAGAHRRARGAVVSEFPLGTPPLPRSLSRGATASSPGWSPGRGGGGGGARGAAPSSPRALAAGRGPRRPGRARPSLRARLPKARTSFFGTAPPSSATPRDVAAELGFELPARRRRRPPGDRRRASGLEPGRPAEPRGPPGAERAGRRRAPGPSHVSWSCATRVRRLPGPLFVRHRDRTRLRGGRTTWPRTSSSSSRPPRRRRSTSISGKDFIGEGLHGPRPRPAQEEAGRRREEGVRRGVRGPRHPQEDPRRAEGRGQGRGRDLPGRRPRPRGRGHLLAPRRGARACAAKKKFQRVVFNEITKQAIEEAFKNPGEVDEKKVDAQQARRILDRLVGYKVSPILWDKVRRGLSRRAACSRVALRLICDREREIRPSCPRSTGRWPAHLEAAEPPALPGQPRQEGRQEPRDRQRRARRAPCASDLEAAAFTRREGPGPRSAAATRCRPSSPRSCSRRPSRSCASP